MRVDCAYDKLVAADSLRPNPANPNQHPEGQVEKLAQLIKAHGWRHPITVSKQSGFIVAGHCRLMAAKLLGQTEVPVDYQDFVSNEEELAVLVSDNVVQELCEVDGLKMADILVQLDQMDYDLDLTALDEMQIDDYITGPIELNPQDDIVPEPPAEPITKTGDLWLLGEHRLLCGDSTIKADVGRLMGQEKAVLMATDPPYGVAYGVETGQGSKFGAIDNDENDGEKLQMFLEACFKIAPLEKNAAWYLWHAQMTQGFFAAAAAAANVIIHRQIIWVKPSLILGHGDYHWRHELCFYGWAQGNRPNWYGDRTQTTVWEIGRENDGIHPTQKPVEIFTRPLRFNTMANDIVYEPFSGSGSQLIACEKLNRRCYGMEIDPIYCDVIVKRWEEYTGKKAELSNVE